jgi:hypothetical protein
MRLHYRSPARKGYGLHLRCQPPSAIARSIVARSLWMGRGQPRPLLATRHLEHPAGRAGPGGRPARPAHPARPVRLPPRHIHRRGLRQPLQRDRRQPLNPQRPIHRCRWRPHNKQAKEHGNRESRPRPPRRHTRLGGHRRLRARQPLQRALPRQHIVRQSEAQPLVKKTAALTLSILAIVLPFVAVALIPVAGNILALGLAITAIVLARGALRTSALSGSGRTRSRWAVGISIVVIIIWVIAFTQGV